MSAVSTTAPAAQRARPAARRLGWAITLARAACRVRRRRATRPPRGAWWSSSRAIPSAQMLWSGLPPSMSESKPTSNLSGLEHVQIGGLFIGYNEKLTSLAGFNPAIQLLSSLGIQQNPVLGDLSALGMLERVTESLQVDGTNAPTLSGFEQLTQVGSLSLTNNIQLTSLAAVADVGSRARDYRQSTVTDVSGAGARGSLGRQPRLRSRARQFWPAGPAIDAAVTQVCITGTRASA